MSELRIIIGLLGGFVPLAAGIAEPLAIQASVVTKPPKIRLEMTINYGYLHAICEQSEIPHILEHIVLADVRDGQNLRQYFESFGGYVNGLVTTVDTLYTFELPADKLDDSLDRIVPAFRDVQFSETAIQSALKDIRNEYNHSGNLTRSITAEEHLLRSLYDLNNRTCDRVAMMGYTSQALEKAYKQSYSKSLVHVRVTNMINEAQGKVIRSRLDPMFSSYPVERSSISYTGKTGMSLQANSHLPVSTVAALFPLHQWNGFGDDVIKVRSADLIEALYSFIRDEKQWAYSPRFSIRKSDALSYLYIHFGASDPKAVARELLEWFQRQSGKRWYPGAGTVFTGTETTGQAFRSWLSKALLIMLGVVVGLFLSERLKKKQSV
ncbi:MAG: insulinase family protein [Pseudomonadales bacterium]